MTTVSVCIPSIPPRARFLPRAVASVAAQTRPADQIVVSVDREGLGAAANRNRAVAAATGEWLAFLDDDDELLPSHLERLLDCAAQTGADLVYPWYEGINVDIFKVPASDGVGLVHPLGRPWDDAMSAYLRSAGNFIPVTVLARAETVRDAGGFQATFDGADAGDDWGLWCRMLDAGARFAHLPEVTWRWNGHSGHTSGRPWTALTSPSGSFRSHR